MARPSTDLDSLCRGWYDRNLQLVEPSSFRSIYKSKLNRKEEPERWVKGRRIETSRGAPAPLAREADRNGWHLYPSLN